MFTKRLFVTAVLFSLLLLLSGCNSIKGDVVDILFKTAYKLNSTVEKTNKSVDNFKTNTTVGQFSCETELFLATKDKKAFVAFEKTRECLLSPNSLRYNCSYVDKCEHLSDCPSGLWYLLKKPFDNISESNRLIYGYSYSGDEFPQCRKGSLQGENVNYYYCTGGMQIETPAVIDLSGDIIEPERSDSYYYNLILEEKNDRAKVSGSEYTFFEVSIINASCIVPKSWYYN